MPGPRRSSTASGHSVTPMSWRRRVAWTVGIALTASVAAILVCYRVSLAPSSLHPREVQFSVARADLFVDTQVSQLLDRQQDAYLVWNPRMTQNEGLLLQAQAARQIAANAAGIPGQMIRVSGPFSEQLAPSTQFGPTGPQLEPTPRVNQNYRLLVDFDGARPMISLFGQAPTTKAALAIVTSMRQYLIDYVAQLSRHAPDVPYYQRTVIRPLGQATGAVVDPNAQFELLGFIFGLVALLGVGVMSATETWLRRRAGTEPEPHPTPLVDGSDDWPHTRRLLPWTMAAFLVMIFLVPIDGVTLPVHLPMASSPDRVLLLLIIAIWFGTKLLGRPASRPRARFTRVHVAVILFLGVALASDGINSGSLAMFQEGTATFKKLLLLGSIVTFFLIASSVLRPAEVPRLIKLMIWLGVIVAFFAVIEAKTHSDIFYTIWQKISSVTLPNELDQKDEIGRLTVDGPTSEPLELAALITMVLPFTILATIEADGRKERLKYVLATAILIAGALSTARKTSIVAPLVAVLVLTAYRPRVMLRGLLISALPLFVIVHLIAPGQLGSVVSELLPGNASNVSTTTDRVARYDGVRPDVMSHLLVGRGFQSFDPHKYRILDNEFLGLLIGVGAIGLAFYLSIFGSLLTITHPLIRGPDPRRAVVALGAQAAVIIAMVSNALFDVLSFAHVSYLMFFVGAMVVALRKDGVPAGLASAPRARPPETAPVRTLAPPESSLPPAVARPALEPVPM